MDEIIDEVILQLGPEKKLFGVLAHNFCISQLASKSGKPTGKPVCESFTLKVESLGKDSMLMQWAIDATKALDGAINFMADDSIIYQIVFSKTFCISYTNTGKYDLSAGDSTLTETITIVPNSFKWQNAEYKKATLKKAA